MNGLILINKPKGYTSHDIVGIVRKTIGIKKVGHTGTLDPNATGVLPVLIGEATKASKYLIEHNKTYIATLKLGNSTSTGDQEGEIIEEKDVPEIDKGKITDVLNSFKGKQTQIPPIYSAIKVNGKKLYEYARENKEVEIKPREIEIINIKLIDFNKDIIIFEVECSIGTYIRTLCEDIAKKLGTVGYMKELERTKVNNFTIDNALGIDNLNKEFIENNIISLEELFNDNEKIELDDKKLELFLNGVQLTYNLKDEVYRVYNNNCFVGLGIINNNLLKRDIIII